MSELCRCIGGGLGAGFFKLNEDSLVKRGFLFFPSSLEADLEESDRSVGGPTSPFDTRAGPLTPFLR